MQTVQVTPFRPASPRTRVAVLRSREQSIGLFVVGLFAAVFFPWQAFASDAEGNVLPAPIAWTFAVAGVALGGFFMLRLARCGVRVFESGVRIVNPFGSRFLSWDAVQTFSLRPWNLFPSMAHADLVDGPSLHVWGIQAPNLLTRRRNTSAERLVDELNRLRDVYAR